MNKEDLIKKAIKERKVISFIYKSHKRTVEPFTLGLLKPWNNLSLSAYRLRGYTSKISFSEWRVYKLNEMSEIFIENEQAESFRYGYNKYDSRMTLIICAV
jgi:predicted DNA-binding transcriptional regulator YafY